MLSVDSNTKTDGLFEKMISVMRNAKVVKGVEFLVFLH